MDAQNNANDEAQTAALNDTAKAFDADRLLVVFSNSGGVGISFRNVATAIEIRDLLNAAIETIESAILQGPAAGSA